MKPLIMTKTIEQIRFEISKWSREKQEYWGELAAKFEFDAGYFIDEAEIMAYEEMQKQLTIKEVQ